MTTCLNLLLLSTCAGWPIRSVGGNIVSPEDRKIQAYDCSEPLQQITVQTGEGHECEEKAEAEMQRDNVTFSLLQEAHNEQLKVRTCELVRTSLTFYCGIYDHQTFVPRLSEVHVRKKVSITDCRTWWNDGMYTDDSSAEKEHELISNGVTTITFPKTGSYSHATSGGDAKCEGEIVHGDSGWYDRLVTTTQVSVRLVEEDANIVSDGVHKSITMLHRRLELPCGVHEAACVTARTTYIWDPPRQGDGSCSLYFLRTTSGIEVSGANGATTYISNDESMIRVIKRDPIARCGSVVHPTNYEQLFLTTAYNYPPFKRKLPLQEMSIITYATQQDKFLYGTLSDYIESEYKNIIEAHCKQNREDASLQYARMASEQGSSQDGDTVGLGEGWFATAAGEAWHKYRCRPITVVARESKECYSSLPVSLSLVDLQRYRLARTMKITQDGVEQTTSTPSAQAQDFFVEPYTHRLTTMGGDITCLDTFPALYKTLTGKWIQATPEIRLTATPLILGGTDEYAKIKKNGPPDFSEVDGGIYPAAMVEQLAKHTSNPRTGVLINHKLADQAWPNLQEGNVGTLPAYKLFKELPHISPWWAQIWTWLDRWGRFAAVVMLLVWIGIFVKGVIGLIMRLSVFHRAYGWSNKLFRALVPHGMTWYEVKSRGRTWVDHNTSVPPSDASDEESHQRRKRRRQKRKALEAQGRASRSRGSNRWGSETTLGEDWDDFRRRHSRHDRRKRSESHWGSDSSLGSIDSRKTLQRTSSQTSKAPGIGFSLTPIQEDKEAAKPQSQWRSMQVFRPRSKARTAGDRPFGSSKSLASRREDERHPTPAPSYRELREGLPEEEPTVPPQVPDPPPFPTLSVGPSRPPSVYEAPPPFTSTDNLTEETKAPDPEKEGLSKTTQARRPRKSTESLTSISSQLSAAQAAFTRKKG